MAPAAWFANASRYHKGGIAGLKPNETPAILEKTEEVLTQDDPRHILNPNSKGGGGGVKIVNAFDAGDFISEGLESKNGERAFMNFVRARSKAVKQALG